MVWFFLIPSIPTVLGNFVIPMMIGARDVAFPKLNLLSWYLFITGGGWQSIQLFLAGWIPGGLFTRRTAAFIQFSRGGNGHGYFYRRLRLDSDRAQFIITIHTMRAPGLTWHRLPLFIWSLYSTSIILVLATPVLAITLASWPGAHLGPRSV